MFSNPSSYGRPRSSLGDNKTLTKTIENLITNIKNIENSPLKPQEASRTPSVVNRLVDKEGKYYRRRKTLPVQNHTARKTKHVREVRKQVTALDENPGAAHYKPNFDAVLSNDPKLTIPKAVETPDVSSVDVVPMSEMLNAFSSHIRSVSFAHDKSGSKSDFRPLEPSCVENQKSYIMPAKDDPLVDASQKRDSYIVGEATPGPSAYTVFVKKSNKYIKPFSRQTSREELGEHFEKPIRNVGSAIDSTLKRTPKAIPFDKQAPRERKKKSEDVVWKEVEEEQKRLVEEFLNEEKGRKEIETTTKETHKKRVEPMSRGGRDPRGPFAHLMRKETEPTVPYDVDRGYRYFERPKTSYNIGQKSFKEDRQIYVKSEAPDIMYNNVDDEWKKTQPTYNVPDFDKRHDRYDAYYYMPKPCGEEDKRSKRKIYEEERLRRERETPKTQLRRGKPKALKRIIDTPLSIQRHTSVIENRYADIFN